MSCQRAAGSLPTSVRAAAEPARFARRRIRRAGPRLRCGLKARCRSEPLPRRVAQKNISLMKIVFSLARVPSALIPAFRLRAERRMELGSHETMQSADHSDSPPFVVAGCQPAPRRRATPDQHPPQRGGVIVSRISWRRRFAMRARSCFKDEHAPHLSVLSSRLHVSSCPCV